MDDDHAGDAPARISRRRFARGVLLGAPAAIVATDLATAPAGAAAQPSWLVGGNALTAAGSIGTTSAYPMQFLTADKERMRIANSGRVGIGITSPTAALHVANGTGTNPTLQVEHGGTGGEDAVHVTSPTTGSGNAVGAYLTADDPGVVAAAVWGQAYTATGDGYGTAGIHDGSGVGLFGRVDGAGAGVLGRSLSVDGLGGRFENANRDNSGRNGAALRAHAGSGTDDQLRAGAAQLGVGFAAGEFVGPTAVLGVADGEPMNDRGVGVLGVGPNLSNGFGVAGFGGANDAAGVYGAGTVGLRAVGRGAHARAIYATTSDPTSTAIVAAASDDSHTAIEADGNVVVNGSISKAGGSFRIDHPLDPERRYLSHSFVESPDMMNVYNGNVTVDDAGEATVAMPDWFAALNRDFRYQLTPLGVPSVPYVKHELAHGRFTIAGGKPGQRISWQVTGIRQDAWANAHRIPVEHDKPVVTRHRPVATG